MKLSDTPFFNPPPFLWEKYETLPLYKGGLPTTAWINKNRNLRDKHQNEIKPMALKILRDTAKNTSVFYCIMTEQVKESTKNKQIEVCFR